MKVKFQHFKLDCERQELLANGKPVSIPPKAFAVLSYLVEHRDRLVSKRELLDAFWPANISESALLKTISLIRQAFNEGSTDAPFIKTHHGLGYRFIQAVEILPAQSDPAKKPQISEPVLLSEQHLASVLCVQFRETGINAAGNESDDHALETYLATARAIVDAHQGQLLHMMLDGFTAAFGLHQHYEDAARRASCCAAALAKNTNYSELNKANLSPSMGIDTGSVVLAKDAANPHWMPPNNIERSAKSLAQKANKGEVLLSETTCQQLFDEAEIEPAANAFRLISAPPQRAGIPGRPQKRPSQFVGRLAELAFLTTQFNTLDSKHGLAIMLKGPAGIGKSRLVTEFLARLDPDGFRCLQVNCLPGLDNMPLAPIRDLCLAMLKDKPQPGFTDEIDMAILSELQGTHSSGEPVLQGLSDHQLRQRSYQLIDRLLHQICDEIPLLIVFEDVHWTDRTSQEYLDEIIRHLDNKRLMLLLTSRPSESMSLIETVLQLSPLGRSESLEMLRSNPETSNLNDEAVNTLVQRASGNPFFLEELSLAAQAGANVAKDLPDSIQAVIAVRIAALAPGFRNYLYIISVIGPPASLSLVAYLLGQSSADTRAGLDWLTKNGFIVQDLEGFTFRHMLIHDTAYAMIARQDRSRLHGQIAHYLDNPESVEPARPETLAWHYQQAGETNKAILFWTTASRAALHRSVHHEAIAFARHGIALIDSNTPDHQSRELDLQLSLAPALTALQGFGAHQVGATYYRAQSLSQVVGTEKTRIRILVGLWIHTWVRGKLAESLSHADKLMELAIDLSKPALKLQANASKGQVLLHLGQTQAALDHLQTGLNYLGNQPPETLPEQNAAVACAAYAAWSASLLGASEEAANFYRLSKHLQQTFNNPFAEAIHCALCSEHFMFEGNVTECLSLAERAVEISRQHNFPFWLGTGLIMKGWALGQQGVIDNALTTLQEGISVFEATGAGVQLANWYGLKAETLLAANQYQDGLDAVERALQYAQQAEDVFFVPRIHATAARLHQLTGTTDRYEWHKQQALQLAKRFTITPRIIAITA